MMKRAIKKVVKKPTRNSAVLADFVDYCKSNPTQRFWQALRNWSAYNYIFVSKQYSDSAAVDGYEDTFYWEGMDF